MVGSVLSRPSTRCTYLKYSLVKNDFGPYLDSNFTMMFAKILKNTPNPITMKYPTPIERGASPSK